MSEFNMTETDIAFRKIVVEAGAEENLLDAETLESSKGVEETEEYEIDVTEEEVAIIKEVLAKGGEFVVHMDSGNEDRGGYTNGPARHDSFQRGEFEAELEFDERVTIDLDTAKLNEEDMAFKFTVETIANYEYEVTRSD